MKTRTLITASLSIAITAIATAERPASAQYYGGYGYSTPYYPQQTQQTIYYPVPAPQSDCPPPMSSTPSRGTGYIFDGMQRGIRGFFGCN